MTTAATATNRRLERLRGLTAVSRALTYATSIEEVLELAVRRAAELVEADRVVLMLMDDEGLLEVRAAHGIEEARLAEVHESLDEGLVRRLRDLLGFQSDDSFLSVPLVAQGEVTGLLGAVRSGGEPTARDDEWLLSALADQAAVALENARLVQTVVRERDERGRAVEAQGRARATLGHELRSPLNAIQSYSHLLLEGALGPLTERQREGVARIRMGGEHLLAVIDNVLDMARIQAGAVTLRKRAVAVRDVVTEALQLVQHRAAEKDQELNADFGEDIVVRADPQRLRQALVNLVGNAVKYSPRGGDIRVSVSVLHREGRDRAAIAVSDDGRGIPASHLATIFEPYERGGAGDHEGGLGLGLSISRELVRQMDGDIEVESEPGSGSTFTVWLPVADERER